ncbi:hypothetical protein [Abyssalbus ytuae]|nr:hypothetical protein [Abyssalbus ytuae]
MDNIVLVKAKIDMETGRDKFNYIESVITPAGIFSTGRFKIKFI